MELTSQVAYCNIYKSIFSICNIYNESPPLGGDGGGGGRTCYVVRCVLRFNLPLTVCPPGSMLDPWPLNKNK